MIRHVTYNAQNTTVHNDHNILSFLTQVSETWSRRFCDDVIQICSHYRMNVVRMECIWWLNHCYHAMRYSPTIPFSSGCIVKQRRFPCVGNHQTRITHLTTRRHWNLYVYKYHEQTLYPVKNSTCTIYHLGRNCSINFPIGNPTNASTRLSTDTTRQRVRHARTHQHASTSWRFHLVCPWWLDHSTESQ